MEALKEMEVLARIQKTLNEEAKENKVNFRSGATYSKGNRCGLEYSYKHKLFKVELERNSLELEYEEVVSMFREKIEEINQNFEDNKDKKDKRKKQDPDQ